jgi:2-polyprenyl-6-hydroxyphenyl methylase / 3-demethylubiquinone-9 3-methyltransferase
MPLAQPRTTSRANVRLPRNALPRNDVRQYDELAGEWWRPNGAFMMLHWIAAARAALIPEATRPGAVLVDLGCGAGLLAPTCSGWGTGTSGSIWSRPR